MEVIVFGAGSLGSLIGGLLAREHDVTLVGRDPHVEAVRRRGLEVTGEFDLTTDPDARTDLSSFSPSADLGVVTVKSFDTEAAARALAGRVDVALSVQNGMGNEETLRGEIDRVLAGTCTYGAILRKPGVVECTGRGEIVFGPFAEARRVNGEWADRADRDVAERVGEAFRSAGIVATVDEEMADRLWEKLAINAGINPITALARIPNGALEDGPAHVRALAAARETAQVAREQGVDLSDEKAAGALEDVIETTAANESSMLRDVQQCRRTEIDAISGYVIDRATEPVPVTETLRDVIRAWERAHSVR